MLKIKNRKQIAKMFFFLVIVLIASISLVKANNDSGNTTGGSGGSQYDSCNYAYCFGASGGNGYGIRLSLYEYDGKNLVYHSSVDFCSGGGCFDGRTAATTVNKAGKVAYQSGKASYSWSDTPTTINANTSIRFSCYDEGSCSYINVENQIKDLFKFDTQNYDDVSAAIKSVFGKQLDDLTYTYITVEPTLFFYKSGTGNYFYGTPYELIRSNKQFLYEDGMRYVITRNTPTAIMASSVASGKVDDYNFVSYDGSGLVQIVPSSFYQSSDNINNAMITNRYGLGINVFWVGSPDIVPSPSKTCQSTCRGTSGDGLLACAENFCQINTTDSTSKRECITSCGYTPKSFSSCGSDQLTDGDDTVCSASTTGSISSCTKATTSTYYKTTCTESSTIQYGNSLPTTLRPGTSFSYTPVLSGSKQCEMTFETEKWKFDYAASYTSAERTKLLGILQNFQKIDSTSIWYKDLNNNYKYDSSNADITIEVSNSNNSKDTTTKKLEANETINLLDDTIKVSSGGSVSVPLFNSGNKTTQTVFGVIKTNSSNKTSYRLPAVCIRAGDGELYNADSNGNCDSKNDGPYYDYFTELKINEGIYDTETTVNKGSSNLDVSNTCNYNIDNGNDPVTCSIVRDPDDNNRYELRIENKNKVKVTYGLSGTKYELNGLTEYRVNSSNFKLYGVVADEDGNFLATCDNNGNNNNGENTCTALFKAAEYDKIKDYCDANWLSDTANYSSASDCFNSCSYGNNTCKNNPDFDSSDEAAVERYCETNYLKDGYKNEASCLNDCLDLPRPDDEPCLGVACDYLYRPISLIDPFPNNRRPGYNWYGKEIYITDDLLNPVLNPGTPAEYVIELTPDRIDSIRSQTLRYNATNEGGNAYIDYVYENENKRDGAYESKFIHTNDVGDGGFYSFFTLIEGRGV